jgi:quinol monooxygenase YgiN
VLEAAIGRVHDEPGVELYALPEGSDRLVMIEKYESEQARSEHSKGAALADLLSVWTASSTAASTCKSSFPIRPETRRRAFCDGR